MSCRPGWIFRCTTTLAKEIMPNGQIDMPIDQVRSRNPGLAMSEAEHQVASLIRRRCREDPIRVSTIVDETGMTDRSVRNIIRDLVMEHRLPIGSLCAADRPGFYWISDPAELKQAADRHISFGITNIVRGRRLFGYNKDELVGQIEAALED